MILCIFILRYDTMISGKWQLCSKYKPLTQTMTQKQHSEVPTMKDSLRESLSYWGLYWKMFQVKKAIKAQAVSFGNDKQQYFLYYEPEHIASDKVIIWVHGGGWNAGSPKLFDFVEQ